MNHNVSVIMPVLNGQKYLAEAIDSIIGQTYKDFELIVVNDGSTNETVDLLKSFTERLDLVCIHHDRPRGIARSVNEAIRLARGQFIAFLDHDDLWFPYFLETQMAHLAEHPDVGMVHSDFQTIDSTGTILEASVAACRNRKRVSGQVFSTLFQDSFIVGNSVLVRKKCFDRLGTFDETLRIGDYHMWLRIARHYKVDYTPKVLTKYRQHQSQDSRAYSTQEDSPALMAIKSILRLYPEVEQELGAGVIRRRMAALYFDLAYSSFSKGFASNTRVFLSKAIRLRPLHYPSYLLYAGSFFKPAQIQAARKMWHLGETRGF